MTTVKGTRRGCISCRRIKRIRDDAQNNQRTYQERLNVGEYYSGVLAKHVAEVHRKD